ncbi:MAG: hypothetical protein EOO50_13345 [Flavobacterium sp.]|uniref:STM3941 family protein n=1 Tax=Flavobacterium sp. TaxID=239 RepID=UPI0012221074|nr:STM3941 family protein [Flavobacterium sp.]RZJ65526.1 MAG: hypothetical protein EOO50_13345 [Flavobacterium sp.]
MTKLKLYKSGWKGIRLLALTLPFVLIGILIISKEQAGTFDYAMGWFCVSFFGLGIPLGLFLLLDRRPQIVIDEDGVWDRSLKQDAIKWEQIVETYAIDIHGQKFISVVVDESFEPKRKTVKWARKLNEFVGAQTTNLNVSQIKIDANKLSDLLNKIKNSDKHERASHLRIFSSEQRLTPNFEFQNYVTYLIILAIFMLISLSGEMGFMSIMVIMGVSAVIARWHGGTNNKSSLYKYARITTFLGFANMVVLFLMFTIHDAVSDKLGAELTQKIEKYKSKFGKYPTSIQPIREKMHLNLIQDHIFDEIAYRNLGARYELTLEFLNRNQKEFDVESNRWN